MLWNNFRKPFNKIYYQREYKLRNRDNKITRFENLSKMDLHEPR